MKSLGAAEADFWTRDLSEFHESYELRWERRDPAGLVGTETLKLSMLSAWPGQSWALPSQDLRVDYAMAMPAKGQGARAVDLRGRISVLGKDRIWIDLAARMERIDVPGVEFDEQVRGLFTLPVK